MDSPSIKSAFKSGHVWSIVLLALMGGASALLYNNCGGRGRVPNEGQKDIHTLQNEIRASGALKESDCADASLYSCDEKEFGPTLPNSQDVIQFPCVRMKDRPFCLSGLKFTYNTQQATNDCGPNCPYSYEYKEFHCYFKPISVDGLPPIQGDQPTLERSIGETVAACMNSVGGP